MLVEDQDGPAKKLMVQEKILHPLLDLIIEHVNPAELDKI